MASTDHATIYRFEYQQTVQFQRNQVTSIVLIRKDPQKFGWGWIQFNQPIPCSQAIKCCYPVLKMKAETRYEWKQICQACKSTAKENHMIYYHSFKLCKTNSTWRTTITVEDKNDPY